MKSVALSLGALALLSVAADRAKAEGALSYPMAAHVAAKYGIQHSGLPAQVKQYHQAKFYHEARREFSRHGHHGHHGHHGYHGHHKYRGHHGYHGCHRPLVIPYYAPYVRPYYPRPYYVRPGISYYGNGFSLGIGF